MLISRSHLSDDKKNSTVKVVFDAEQAEDDLRRVKNNCKKLCISNKEANKKYITIGVLICIFIILLSSILLPFLYTNKIGPFVNLDITCFCAAFAILSCFGVWALISNSLENTNEEFMISMEKHCSKYEYLEHVAPYTILSVKRTIVDNTDDGCFVTVIFVLQKSTDNKKVKTLVEEYEMEFEGIYSTEINEETLDIAEDAYYIPYKTT